MACASQLRGPSHRDEDTRVSFAQSHVIDKKLHRIRILIVDNCPVFRYGLRMLLRPEADMQIVGEASDGVEGVKLVGELRPDVLLFDLTSQRVTDAQALERIARLHPDVRTILMLTAEAEKRRIVDALQLGVRGVVMKTASTKAFIKSIRTVMAGEYWIPRSNVADLVCILKGAPGDSNQKPRTLNLTARELEIVTAVAGGYTNRDVAERFSISEDTVKHHLTNIFDKLGVANRLELAILAIGRGLVTPA